MFSDSDGDSIRLAGTKKEQWRALGYLQTLTNDKLTIKNGTVMIEKVGGANPNKELPSGTALIAELVSHKKSTYIHQNTSAAKNSDRASGNVLESKSNGVGPDATVINIDLTKANETTLLIENPESGKSVWKKTTRESSLAHELIHTLYTLNGQNIPREGKNAKFETYTYTDPFGKQITVTEPKEETDTVGITGNRKYTENKIRNEQGWGKRVKY